VAQLKTTLWRKNISRKSHKSNSLFCFIQKKRTKKRRLGGNFLPPGYPIRVKTCTIVGFRCCLPDQHKANVVPSYPTLFSGYVSIHLPILWQAQWSALHFLYIQIKIQTSIGWVIFDLRICTHSTSHNDEVVCHLTSVLGNLWVYEYTIYTNIRIIKIDYIDEFTKYMNSFTHLFRRFI